MNRLLRNTVFGGLGLLLFINVACSTGQSTQPTPNQPTSRAPPTLSSPIPTSTLTATSNTLSSVENPYHAGVSDYKQIDPDIWIGYNTGLPERGETSILRNKNLTLNGVYAKRTNGSILEYLELVEDNTPKLYWVTWDRTNDSIAVESSEEVKERIKNKESELFTSILTDIENKTSPNPSVARTMRSENPYVVGTALNHVLEDVEIIDFANGEVYPFINYNAQLSSGKLEFELSGVPESALIYFLMDRFGVNYTIPFVEKELGMIVGERIAEGKLYESPLGTKTNVRISHELGSDKINVSSGIGDSALVRVTKYTYYSIKAGRVLEAEEVPPPLKEYNFELSINPEETLKAVGEYLAERNREEQGRKKTQQETSQFIEGGKEKVSDMQKESERQQEKAMQKAEELKKRAEEEIRKKKEELIRQAEEEKKRAEEALKKSREDIEESIKKGKSAICDNFPNLPACKN